MAQLRFNLQVSDGTAPAYWKGDGKRFDGTGSTIYDLCSGNTLKLCSGKTYQLSLTSNQPVYIREGSGRWGTREIDPKEAKKQQKAAAAAAQPGGPGPTPGAAPDAGRAPAPWSRVDPASAVSASPFAASDQPPPPPPPSTHSPAAAPPPPPVVQDAPAAAASATPLLARPEEPTESEGALAWADASVDATRSTYKASLTWRVRPTSSGRRLYLLVEAYVEEFGLVICPLQIKVYHRADKGALSTFPLRYVQYDFRRDSSEQAKLMAVNFHGYRSF